MKRFLIIAVAVLAAVLFTACPNKPTDEPVVIPDGTYEETAHFQRQSLRIIDNDSSYVVQDFDTILATTVIISNGEFIYPDMCDYPRDTFASSFIFYSSPFIYNANDYCYTNRIPAEMSVDGNVTFKQPAFPCYWVVYPLDSNYVYRAPVSMRDGMYTFQHSHDFREQHVRVSIYNISHTLRPL